MFLGNSSRKLSDRSRRTKYHSRHPPCTSVNPSNCPPAYDLTDTPQTDNPLDPSANHPNTNQAIVDTAGQYLTYYGAMLWPRYRQHKGDSTVAYAGYDLPVSSVSDPIDADETRTGHGNGVCQYSSRHWARGRSANDVPFPQWDYWGILAHYYTAAEVQGFPTNVPTYHRRNMLTTSANTSALPTNADLQVAVRI
jgi:peptidoglycan hydrolase-like amidase